MPRLLVFILAALVLTSASATTAEGQASGGPETVVVRNGSVTLHVLRWRPHGRGPFPAILLNHGSGRRGVGLSADQGASAIDLMTGELAARSR